MFTGKESSSSSSVIATNANTHSTIHQTADQFAPTVIVIKQNMETDLIHLLKEYLSHPSTDGHPIRQKQRKQLALLIDQIEVKIKETP